MIAFAQVGIHTELYQMARGNWRSLVGSCSKNYISDDKLGALLKQWAGDDDDAKNKEVEVRILFCPCPSSNLMS